MNVVKCSDEYFVFRQGAWDSYPDREVSAEKVSCYKIPLRKGWISGLKKVNSEADNEN